MKTVELMQIDRNEFNITNIRPVSQYFKEGEIFTYCKSSRRDCALCYLSACGVDYFSPEGTPLLSAERGSIIYLPQGGEYIAQFRGIADSNSDDEFSLSDHLVNFIIRDSDGEPLRFSDCPMLICTHTDIEIGGLFEQLLDEEYRIVRSELRLHRLLYELLDRLFCRSEPVYDSILHPAFDYITTHPQFNRISIGTLAEICHIHPVTFRRRFESLFHIPPRQYIDAYFIRLADYNLMQRHKSVAETAQLLGFNDVSYFCRFYRKHTGVSPGHYKKQ